MEILGISPFDDELLKLQASLNQLLGKWPDQQAAFHKQMVEVYAEIRVRREKNEEEIKRCHPNDVHWPPHDDCPVCNKIIDAIECRTVRWCEEHDLDHEDDHYYAVGMMAISRRGVDNGLA